MVAHLALALHAGRLQREPTSLTLVEQSADGPVLHSPGLGNPDRVTATTNGPNGHTAEDAGPWLSGERTVRDRSTIAFIIETIMRWSMVPPKAL